jgi:hypothetical protein
MPSEGKIYILVFCETVKICGLEKKIQIEIDHTSNIVHLIDLQDFFKGISPPPRFMTTRANIILYHYIFYELTLDLVKYWQVLVIRRE